jgi:hypothetical protein
MVARLFAFLVVAALAVVALAASPAAGASYATKVVVSFKTPAFHGKLKSGKSSCASGRTVKLFRKKRGADEFLGSDRSNANGSWSIPIRLRSGSSYYAKAPAKGSCKEDKSRVIAIG